MPDPRLTCLKTTPFTALHTYRYVCIYNIYSFHTCMAFFTPPRAPRVLLKTLVRDKVLCLFHKNCYYQSDHPLAVHKRARRKKVLFVMSLQGVVLSLYCVSIFIEHKDEIYEEDLKEGWTFLGRKKVQIVFIVVLVVFLFKWGVPVCHLYCNTITLVQTNPLKFQA